MNVFERTRAVVMRRSMVHLLIGVSVSWVGCSSHRDSFSSAPRGLGDTDAGIVDIDAGCAGLVCSPDLRSVRRCDGTVIEACGPDTACGNGKCIAPCDAAAINEGSVGCSFALSGNIESGEARGSCAAVFVANNWTSPANVRVTFQGEEKSLEGAVWVPFVEDGIVKHRRLDGPIPPGGGAVVFLSNETSGAFSWVRCPLGVRPVLDRDTSVYGTGIGEAAFATADVPVSMYAMYPYGGAASAIPSGTLLFPTTSFRKNYVVVSSWGGRDDVFGSGVLGPDDGTQPGKPALQIVAIEDDTSIDLLPKVDVAGGRDIPASPANRITNFRLQRGQVLQLTQQQELVGSPLESNKPVGLFGGHTCMNLPVGNGWCDSEKKQIPPISSWGYEHAVLPAPDRVRMSGARTDRSSELSVIRMVGAADGSALVYEPYPPAGAPSTLGSGEIARFFASAPFVVRSQDAAHPFYVATSMTGGMYSKAAPLGDPETAISVPTNQWLDSYGFFADYSYMRSAVFVTRRKANGAFQDVTLDCAGALSDWEAITPDYEWTYLELTRGGKAQAYPGGSCSDGAHRIHSDAPFAIAIWGLSQAASYSYPGGTGLRTTTDIKVPLH